ncbi:MAG: phage/plasmid primase, P4 family [Candidatus Nitrosocaldus sp.]
MSDWWEAIKDILAREHALGIDHIPINHYWNDKKQEWNKTPYKDFQLEKHYSYEVYSTLEDLEEYAKRYGCNTFAIRLGRLLRGDQSRYIIGIDVDNKDYASLIDLYLQEEGYDTMKERTPRGGMHFYYYYYPASTNTGNGTSATTSAITIATTNDTANNNNNNNNLVPLPLPLRQQQLLAMDLAPKTGLDIKLYFEKRYFIHIGNCYEMINDISKIKQIESITLLNKIVKNLKRLIMLCYILQPVYVKGNRDYLWLYLSGFLYKHGVPLDEALRICKYVCTFFKDEELRNRLNVVEETYNKKEGEKKEVKGVQGLREILDEEKVKKIISIFSSNNTTSNNNNNDSNNNNNNNNNRNGNGNNNANNTNDGKHTNTSTKWNNSMPVCTRICERLLSEYKQGIKRALFLDNFRFVITKGYEGYWLHWNGSIWEEDNALAVYLHNYCKEVREEILAKEKIDEEEEDDLRFFNIRSSSDLKELMDTLAIYDEIRIREDQLDSFNGIIAKNCAISISFSSYNSSNSSNNNNSSSNCSNNNSSNSSSNRSNSNNNNTSNTYSINVIPLEQIKSYYPTRTINVEYKPDARCDRFKEFLLKICSNNIEKFNFIIKLLGLFLEKRREEIFITFYGVGANGKSTLVKVIASILGDYARFSNVSMINAREEEGKNPELVACKGKNLICIFEPKQVYLNAANLKAITSLEPKSVRTLHRQPIQIIPDFYLLLATNNKPVIKDYTLGMLRRLLMIKFDYIIPEEERIPNYDRILLEEREGILNLMLAGLLKYKQEEEEEGGLLLKIPDIVKRDTAEWLWEIDTLQEFVDRYLVLTYDEKDRIEFSLVYERYKFFCQLKKFNEEDIMSKSQFSKHIKDKGFITELIAKQGGKKITFLCRAKWKDNPEDPVIEEDNNSSNSGSSNSSSGSSNSKTSSPPIANIDNTNNNNNATTTNTTNTITTTTATTITTANSITEDKKEGKRMYKFEELLHVINYIQKYFADYAGYYVCKKCKYTHTPVTLCNAKVTIAELHTLSTTTLEVEEDHELIQTMQDLVYHATLCYAEEVLSRAYMPTTTATTATTTASSTAATTATATDANVG